MWTDNEVEMLLRLTLDYKASKLQVLTGTHASPNNKLISGTVSEGANRGLPSWWHDLFKDPGHHKAKMYSWQIQTGRGHGTLKWPRTGGHAVVWALLGDLGWVVRYSLHWFKHRDGWPGGVIVAALDINRGRCLHHQSHPQNPSTVSLP